MITQFGIRPQLSFGHVAATVTPTGGTAGLPPHQRNAEFVGDEEESHREMTLSPARVLNRPSIAD